MKNTYQGILGLDRIPEVFKSLNLALSFFVVIWIAFKNSSQIANTVHHTMPLRTFLDWLAWISPTCIAIAWLRITGIKWKQTILFFIALPIFYNMIKFILYLLVAFLYVD